MGPCTLQIGSRIIVRSDSGPPEAEYALFDAKSIELTKAESGAQHEVGYRTTVGDAKARLEAAGITFALAEEAAEAMSPELPILYARGTSCRRAAPHLGAYELFESRNFEGTTRRYDGFWLDLAALSVDVKLLRATTAFQAFYLITLLEEHEDGESVALSTAEYIRTRDPGERTFRRVPLDHAKRLPAALKALAASPKPAPSEREQNGPTRTELLETLRQRSAVTGSVALREHIGQIELSLSVRSLPTKGPLADPELWALEEQLSMGDARGVIPKIEVIERAHGRRPSTTYLRARAALVAGVVDPRSIAERISSLVETPNTFEELELLAAEAWLATGEFQRALPYARSLVTKPDVDEQLRATAREVLRKAESKSQPPAHALHHSTRVTQAPLSKPTGTRPPLHSYIPSPSSKHSRPALQEAVFTEDVVSMFDDEGPTQKSPHEAITAYPPEKLEIPAEALGSPMRPPPSLNVEIPKLPPLPTLESISDTPVPGPREDEVDATEDAVEVFFNEGELGSSTKASSSSKVKLAPLDISAKGASRPPFQTVASAPPTSERRQRELAESLSTPPGLRASDRPATMRNLPSDANGARLLCIQFSRELGHDYQNRHGVALIAGPDGIETMQKFLHQRLPTGQVRSEEDLFDVYRHGAFLSEILARELGAVWKSVDSAELGQWRMGVPPSTDIWPFARVFRFLAQGHRERDLVSYFFELRLRTTSKM